ncbi:hypothetical protein ABB37_08717 [Leptomonas pyrrhocoris]|uniref:Uncharacterized protein n=1 Tax=Leptomonas pyrrhocoris TaxID=157538 RepID=A0A0N0VD98_LEPPY|nr:hypothetical protein ABB37_08717 [Leptomonas pyrrhocoris]KPA75028.1 hypothetical protein ABB37_08717 [Leptomonas pyrrhocoris]|eukprot:XP_015653467.1 hypothetical protein ABB37_08717 [Leptomonas pyrrhocoris]
MIVSHSSLSEGAQRVEQDRGRDFFRLLFLFDRARLSLALPVTSVDWKLTLDCLDEMNYRYADYAFLLGFTATYVLRNRGGRTFLSRFRLPIYAGLVMYDLELRLATPAPALQYWNSICTLDSGLGRVARALHTPRCFYEVASDPQESHSDAASSFSALHGGTRTSFFSWLMADLCYGAQSLLLKNVGSYVFDGSCWRHRRSDNVEVTALVVNNRFFRWPIIESCKGQKMEGTEYNINMQWLPTPVADDNIRRSFQCHDLIMEKSTVGGKLWYKTYFALLRLFGLESL